MKKNLHAILVICCLLSVTVLSGYSGGPAATVNRGFTGAPSAGGGTEGNCGSCHNGGDFGTTELEITLVTGGDTLNGSYVPGALHTVTVAISGDDGADPAGYGFQAQFLQDADNVQAGTMSNPGARTQVSDLDNGRSYAEHTSVNPNNSFTFDWTAPPAGTGEVTLYAVGNQVDGGGGTNNDNGSTQPTVIDLTEGVVSSVARTNSQIPFTLAPNPATEHTSLSVDLGRQGSYELKIMNALGRVIQQKTYTLDAGANEVNIELNDLSRGVYIVSLEGVGDRLSTRLVKR